MGSERSATQHQVPVIASSVPMHRVCGAHRLTIEACSHLHLQADVAEVTETFSQQGEKASSRSLLRCAPLLPPKGCDAPPDQHLAGCGIQQS